MSELLLPSRRGFLAGLGACFAAPAIVRATSLMQVRTLDTEWWGPAFCYDQLEVEPDWLTLDAYCARILQPMINTLQANITASIMSGANSSYQGLLE
jgi:hypothetical protein